MQARSPLLHGPRLNILPSKIHYLCWKVTISTAPSEQEVFKPTLKIPLTNGHSLHAYIQCLCQQGQLQSALLHLKDLSSPVPHNAYISLFKTCHRTRSSFCTRNLLSHLYVHSLEFTGFLAEHSVVALVKCGALNDALHVFNKLPSRTAFAWTAIISGFTDCGRYREALQMFVLMQDEGIEPDPYTFVSLFKACGNSANLEIGRGLHAMYRKAGLAMDRHAVATVVSMYGKCGAIKNAEDVFSGVPPTDVVLFNSLLSAYVEGYQAEKALQLYRQMLVEGLCPDKQTLSIALQACGTLATKEGSTNVVGDRHLRKEVVLEIGQSLDADAQSKGFNTDISVITTLVSMYGKCGACHEAEFAFNGMCSPGVIPCTAMLSAYIDGDEKFKALMLYRQMLRERMLPTQHTLVSALKACVLFTSKESVTFVGEHSVREISLNLVKAIHSDAIRSDQALDVFVSNALMSAYGNCDAIKEAQNVFNKLPQPDVVSWTAMLSIYVDLGYGHMALQLYRQMQKEGCYPNNYTVVMALQACALLFEKGHATAEHLTNAPSLEIVRALHVDVERRGLATDVFIATALLNTYGKCGSLLEAKLFFDSFLEYDIALNNAMLSTFVDDNQEGKALEIYGALQTQKLDPDVCTLLCVLQACKEIGALDTCREIHFAVITAGLELHYSLASALIHTYGENASMADAEGVAFGLHQPSIVSFNACIAGYAGKGQCFESLQTLEQLHQADFEPNEVSITSLLSACSHVGFVEQGILCFEHMGRHCGITPELEHYRNVVDLLGRAGDFQKVKNLLEKMSIPVDAYFWSCLLAACSTHGKPELGELAFLHMLELQPHRVSPGGVI